MDLNKQNYWNEMKLYLRIMLIAVLIIFGTGYILDRNKEPHVFEVGEFNTNLIELYIEEKVKCYDFKEGVSMKTIKDTWNHGEGIWLPRDFEEVNCSEDSAP